MKLKISGFEIRLILKNYSSDKGFRYYAHAQPINPTVLLYRYSPPFFFGFLSKSRLKDRRLKKESEVEERND